MMIVAPVSGQRWGFELGVIAGKRAELSGSRGRTDEPAVVALFDHVDHVSFHQLKLVLVLGMIAEQSDVHFQRLFFGRHRFAFRVRQQLWLRRRWLLRSANLPLMALTA